jgi:hypothetical protein
VLFLLGLGAFLGGFCLLGIFHYGYPWPLMRFPVLAAGFTLVLVAVQLSSLRRPSHPAAAAGESHPASSAGEMIGGSERRRILPTTLWLFSVVPAIVLFGYPGGLAIYLACFLTYSGERWTLALGLAAASLPLSYALFVEALGVALPLLPFWWDDFGWPVP